MAADDLIYAKTRQSPATLGRKDRPCRGGIWRRSTYELLQKLCCPLPERTDAPLIAFSVQAYPRLRSKLQVLNPEIRHFLHPAAGVVQHQQECAVA